MVPIKTFLAKNVVLAGVKSVTLYDPEPVTLQKLGHTSQYPWFVLKKGLISCSVLSSTRRYRESRAEATLPRLAELNAYVPVRLLPGQPGQGISVDLVKGYQVHRSNGFWCKFVPYILPGGRAMWCSLQQTTRN